MQIPNAIRPYAVALAKYHFWLLAVVVPLILLPLLVLSKGRMMDDIEKTRGQIKSRLASLKSVQDLQPHPNEAWATEINKTTDAIKRETLQEWRLFWDSQKPLRIWPAALGPDFVQRAAGLKADSKLPRKLLERYQDNVRTLVQDLPGRMGADGAMLEATPAAPGQPPPTDTGANRGGPGGRPPEGSGSLVQWNAEDQKKIYASFNWEKPPTTAQVALAQEELWVYGLLCDAIKRVNATAAGAYNAPIPRVEQLMIGYPAAEDSPGGMGLSRIFRPTFNKGSAMPPPETPSVRPPHPRFGGQGGNSGPIVGFSGNPSGTTEDGGTGGAVVASQDDALRNWIYVHFDGRPLSAAELSELLSRLQPDSPLPSPDETRFLLYWGLHAQPWPADVASSATQRIAYLLGKHFDSICVAPTRTRPLANLWLDWSDAALKLLAKSHHRALPPLSLQPPGALDSRSTRRRRNKRKGKSSSRKRKP